MLLGVSSPAVGTSLRTLLGAHFSIIGIEATGRALIWHAQKYRPDVILLEFDLPVVGGLATARCLRWLAPCSKLVFMASEDDPARTTAALQTGAAVCCWQDPPADLVSVIHNALGRFHAETGNHCIEKHSVRQTIQPTYPHN
jgi:DNA-binding NarL/FixJ family response regulator